MNSGFYLCTVDEIIEEISKAFLKPLPGWDAQKRMINYDRPKVDNIQEIDPQARKSAVLALLYPKAGEIYTVLILRNVYEGTHSGQISFPGGKQESDDSSLWQTALREANEEVGLNPNSVQQLGILTPVYIPPSRFLVTPYLAYAKSAPAFIADPFEVQRIIETPVNLFLDANKIAEKKMFLKSLDNSVTVKYYNVEGEVLWGATAMIISEISEILLSTKLTFQK